jgi:hypothetical protein
MFCSVEMILLGEKVKGLSSFWIAPDRKSWIELE